MLANTSWQNREFPNLGNMPLLLMIEPVGEDYWVVPEGTLIFRYLGEPESLEVVVGKDFFGLQLAHHMMALYPPGCYDWEVFEGEVKVECGHNRPDGFVEELNAKYQEQLNHLTKEQVNSWFQKEDCDDH